MTELTHAVELVGRKWALLIIEDLLGGPRRFSQIERALGDANPKMVAARLRELEAAGLVSRKVFAEVPARVEYSLTGRGRELRPTIEALRRFGTVGSRRRSGTPPA